MRDFEWQESSVTHEIKYSHTKDKLMDELNERERLYKFFGLGGLVKCTKCGGNNRVIPNMTTRDSECIDCFVKRRLKEVFGKE